jgi:hypothetical protein
MGCIFRASSTDIADTSNMHTSAPFILFCCSLAAALQAKFLTLGGTEERHIFDQHGPLPLELEAAKLHCSGNLANPSLQALRTEKIPEDSGCQASTSLANLRDGLILRMAYLPSNSHPHQ